MCIKYYFSAKEAITSQAFAFNMIRKIFVLAVTFLCSASLLHAQQADSMMSIYNDRFATEKIHVHTDRSIYKKGETIFYKAYVLSDRGPAGVSNTLYSDWYDAAGKLLKQDEAPVLLGGAKGSFNVPDGYTDNALHLVCYTRWMLNFDTAFIYKKDITIYQPNTNKVAVDIKMQMPAKTQITFYPEGGFSVAGLNNTIAYAAIDQSGHPVAISAKIKDNKGKMIDSTSSVHDGMGRFKCLLEKDNTYFFNWQDEHGKTGVEELVAQKQAGALLHVDYSNHMASFTIERSVNADKVFKNVHLLIHQNQKLYYKLDIDMSAKTVISSNINLSNLATGITQFTLFNSDWLPVAERIIFADNQKHTFTPAITVKQKDLSKKGLNEIEIALEDTLLTNMSVAVIDVSLAGINDPNIFSDFLMSDELKGNIYNPAYYFSQDVSTDSIQAQLDLVMLTHGHRRFDWEKITHGVLPVISYPPDTNFLQIKGQAAIKRDIKNKDQLSINVIEQAPGRPQHVLSMPINSNGEFKKDSLFFYDTVKFFYSINKRNDVPVTNFDNGLMKSEERKKYFMNVPIPAHSFISSASGTTNFNAQNDANTFSDTYLNKNDQNTVVLKTVKLTTKTKTPKQILDDYYTHGMYAGEGNNIAIDVENDIHASGLNIWTYLQSKIPGLRVSSDLPPMVTWYPSSQGVPGVPEVLLDEMPLNIGSIIDLDVNHIAYVKAFRPPFLGSLLNGFSGVIALYSKKGYSPVTTTSYGPGLPTFLLKGYSSFKEFTQPAYTNDAGKTEEDLRPTLFWNPFILSDKTNAKNTISFYNNDISKKLCLILEGINAEGKLSRIVKMLE